MTHAVHASLPLHIVSEANQREHYMTVARRKALHRNTARCILQSHARPQEPQQVTITLTRIGKRLLDDDNLSGGFKATRDGIADWLGIDDGDRRLKWQYQQRKTAKGEQVGAEVSVTWGE